MYILNELSLIKSFADLTGDFTCVIETCFGESFHLSCMSLVLKDLFPLEIIVVICMKM